MAWSWDGLSRSLRYRNPACLPSMTVEQKCRRLAALWQSSALTLEGAFECNGYARLLRTQARELLAILPKRKAKKGAKR